MITIDPRTKLVLIAITVLFSMIIPTGICTCVWVFLVTLLGIFLGRIKKTIRAAVIFAVFWLVSIYVLPMLKYFGLARSSV